jgi:hypothetical protein
MNTIPRRRNAAIIIVIWAVVLSIAIAAGWLLALAFNPADSPTALLTHATDSCDQAAPPAPCLGYGATPPPTDNVALWGIFLIGAIAGMALAFVLTAGAAYRLGRREGYNDGIVMRKNAQHAMRSGA